jgi:hypothetical protein
MVEVMNLNLLGWFGRHRGRIKDSQEKQEQEINCFCQQPEGQRGRTGKQYYDRRKRPEI